MCAGFQQIFWDTLYNALIVAVFFLSGSIKNLTLASLTCLFTIKNDVRFPFYKLNSCGGLSQNQSNY